MFLLKNITKFLTVIFILITVTSFGQTNYYSKSTGNLNVLANWGTNMDGSGTAPANFTAANQIFNIRNNATPTIGANWTVSGANSKVVVGNGTNACTFTVGGALVFTATCEVSNNAVLSISSTNATPYSGTLTVNNGGTYQHAKNGGAIPTATWAANSTLLVTGIVGTGLTSMGGTSFGNIIWNCPTQTANQVLFGGGIGCTINGNLDVQRTNTGSVIFNSANGTATHRIVGNLTVGNGTNPSTLNLKSGGNGEVNIELNGNLAVNNNATLTRTDGGTASFYFGYTGATTTPVSISGTGTITNTNISYIVQNIPTGKTVNLQRNLAIPTGQAFTVNQGATLNCAATAVISGAGSFVLGNATNGATLGIAHANGINGNITTTTQTFNGNATGTTFVYNSTTASQVTGTNLPATIYNLQINNTFGGSTVTLSQSTTVSNQLTLTSGSFAVGANTLTLNGQPIAGTSANLTTTTSSNLAFGGSATGVFIPSSVSSLSGLTINNTNGVVTNSNLNLAGTLTLTNGKLDIANYNITTSNTATASISGGSATSYIQTSGTGKLIRSILTTDPGGWFRDISYTYPIGDASCYTPVTLNLRLRNTTSVQPWGSLLTIGASTDATALETGGGSYMQRNWLFSKTGTLTGTFTAVFTYGSCTGIVGTESSLLLKYKPVTESIWAPNSSTINTTANTITSGFMDFVKLDNCHYTAFNNSSCAQSNTGPGGVGDATSNVLWLKGEGVVYNGAGVVTTTDNTKISRWNDASGNYNHAYSPVVANQPTYRTNIFKGYPALQCFGDQFVTSNNLSIGTNSGYTVIMVFTEDPGYNATGTINDGNGTQIIDRRPETNPLASFKIVSSGTAGVGKFALQKRNDAGAGLGGPVATGTIVPYTITLVNYMRDYGVDYRMYINNIQDPPTPVADSDGATSLEAPNIGRHSNYTNAGLIGYIAEVVYYNYKINNAQRNIINSYLAAKYSITIANIKYNFGTVYGFDVAGVGREDASNIHNNATSGNMLGLNAPTLANGDYLMWGHNNGSISSWTSDNCPADVQKIARTWRFTKTGNPGAVNIEANLASLPALPVGYKYVLMVKNDGDFTSGADLFELENTCGSLYSINGITITDGDYVSIGVVNPKVQFVLANSEDFEITNAIVTVTTNFTPRTNTTVDFYTTAGTAGALDFTTTSATATIPAGSKTTNITIPLTNDILSENDEQFTITLTNPQAGFSLGTLNTHTYTIHDDDNSRKIYFTTGSSNGTESVTPVTITISVDPSQIDHVNPTSVDYYISGGSATGGGTDYSFTSGTATIPVHAQTTTITLNIVDDGINELVENIIISLTNPINGNLSTVNSIDYTYSILDNDVFGYTGPGGVGNSTNNKLWLMADANVYSNAGTTLATNGNTVQQWNDLSGNNNNATQLTAGNRPTYVTNVVNSKPALQFNGAKSIYPGSLGIAGTDGFTYFTVVGPTAITSGGDISQTATDYIIDRYPAGTTQLTSLKFVNVSGIGPKFGFQKNPDIGGSITGPTAPNTVVVTASPVTFFNIQYYRIPGVGYYITTNGNDQSSISPDFIADPGDDLTPPIPYIGGYNGGTTNGLRGYIAEMAVYSGVLNSAQRLIIDNYLAVKYNIAISDVSRIKYTYGATHKNELAGIGRLSNNSFHTDAQGSGIVRIKNPNKLDNNDFLLWGHDGANLTMTNTGVDGSIIVNRLLRTWKTDLYGNADGVGTITLSVDFTTVAGGISTLPYFLMIDRDGDGFADNDVSPILGTTSGNIVTFENVTFAKGDRFTFGIGASFSWTGNVNKDWSNTGNWSTGTVPTISSSIIIPAGRPNYPELISSSPARCVSIDIQSGAWLAIPSGKALLVSNNIILSGTLTIKSDASGTGTLIENGITQTGNAIVERYITNESWHYLGVPISNADRAMFHPRNFYFYDETVADQWNAADFTSSELGWTDVPTGNIVATNPLRGFAYYYYQSTINFAGTLNTGTKSTTLSYTDNFPAFPQFDGWNLLANPYPSGIDWDLVDKTNIDAAIYYYNTDAGIPNTGNYSYYVSGSGTTPYPIGINNGTRYIPQNQGFFVRASNPSKNGTSFSFNNSMRAIPIRNFYKNTKLEADYYFIRMNIAAGDIKDETLIRFIPEATSNFDKDFDAFKLLSKSGLVPQVYSFDNNNAILAINSLEIINDSTAIDLGIQTGASGEFELNITELNLPAYANAFLYDAQLNKYTAISDNTSYKFNTIKGNDANRFSIRFSESIKKETNKYIQIFSHKNDIYIDLNTHDPVIGEIAVFDISGKTVYTTTYTNDYHHQINLSNNKGIYFVKVTCNEKTTMGKVYIDN